MHLGPSDVRLTCQTPRPSWKIAISDASSPSTSIVSFLIGWSSWSYSSSIAKVSSAVKNEGINKGKEIIEPFSWKKIITTKSLLLEASACSLRYKVARRKIKMSCVTFYKLRDFNDLTCQRGVAPGVVVVFIRGVGLGWWRRCQQRRRRGSSCKPFGLEEQILEVLLAHGQHRERE